MAYRFQIQSPAIESAIMGADFIGGMVFIQFFNGGGLPVTPTGRPVVERSEYATGNIWRSVEPFSAGEWRFNAYAQRVRVNMAGVSGYASYTVEVYRSNDPVPMTPSGAYVGLRAETVQSYTEANVKNGVQYEVASYNAALAASASVRTVFVTGSKPVSVKARIVSFDGQGIEARVYKGTTYTGGTPVPYFNLSDINPVAGTVQVISGATITGTGTEFGARSYLIGSNAPGSQTVGAFGVAGQERNLAPNTTYMLELISMDASQAQRVAAYLS